MLTLRQQSVDPSDTVTRGELQSLRRSYYTFISAIAMGGVSEVLVAGNNGVYLGDIVTSLLQGGMDIADASTQRICFQTVKRLVTSGLDGQCTHSPPPVSARAGFEQFLFAQVIPGTFELLAKPDFDVSDGQVPMQVDRSYLLDAAQSWLTVVEIGAIHKLLLERFQQQYVDYLKGQLLPTLRLPAEAVDGFISALIQVCGAAVSRVAPDPAQMDKNVFAKFLKDFAKRLQLGG